MKGSRRRQSERQRESEGNGDGKIVQRGGDREAKKVTRLYDSGEKWMETEIVPARPAETYKGAQQSWHCGGRGEIWAIGVALTTEKMRRSCEHTLSSQEG